LANSRGNCIQLKPRTWTRFAFPKNFFGAVRYGTQKIIRYIWRRVYDGTIVANRRTLFVRPYTRRIYNNFIVSRVKVKSMTRFHHCTYIVPGYIVRFMYEFSLLFVDNCVYIYKRRTSRVYSIFSFFPRTEISRIQYTRAPARSNIVAYITFIHVYRRTRAKRTHDAWSEFYRKPYF